ncbi:MAG: YfcE family phosphodiesterase [Bacilli bacterium]
MKIIVISDAHGDKHEIEKVYLKEQNCDLFLDCGDSQLTPEEIMPFISVKGNCDFFNFPIKREIKTPFGIIYISHKSPMFFNSKVNDYLFVLSGHTHVVSVKKIENTYFINPGSLTHPRDNELGSYVVIDINESNKEININVKREVL